jgi:hypothetical protein
MTDGALTLRGWMVEAEAAAGIAKALAPTAFVPEHLKVWLNPEAHPSKRQLDYDSTVAQIAAVLLAGQELEFQPMASLRAFVIIRGTVAMYAIAARALLQHHGHEIVVVESTSSRAVVRGRRLGDEKWQEAIWDTERARTAGLLPGGERSNWRTNPKAMMVARATAEVSRWVASDAMLGLPPFAEEVEDADHEVELREIDAAPPPAPAAAEPAKPPATRKRKTTPARAALPAAPPASAAAAVAEPPPPPVAPVPEEPDPGAAPPPSRGELRKLHAALRDLQITGRAEGLALVSAWAGRPVESTSDLNGAEVATVLDRLDALRAIAAQDRAGEEPQDEDGDEDQAADFEPPDDP